MLGRGIISYLVVLFIINLINIDLFLIQRKPLVVFLDIVWTRNNLKFNTKTDLCKCFTNTFCLCVSVCIKTYTYNAIK